MRCRLQKKNLHVPVLDFHISSSKLYHVICKLVGWKLTKAGSEALLHETKSPFQVGLKYDILIKAKPWNPIRPRQLTNLRISQTILYLTPFHYWQVTLGDLTGKRFSYRSWLREAQDGQLSTYLLPQTAESMSQHNEGNLSMMTCIIMLYILFQLAAMNQ